MSRAREGGTYPLPRTESLMDCFAALAMTGGIAAWQARRRSSRSPSLQLGFFANSFSLKFGALRPQELAHSENRPKHGRTHGLSARSSKGRQTRLALRRFQGVNTSTLCSPALISPLRKRSGLASLVSQRGSIGNT